ncbi:hypothetical protein VCV18_000211 [Metarhizium anisopliae]
MNIPSGSKFGFRELEEQVLGLRDIEASYKMVTWELKRDGDRDGNKRASTESGHRKLVKSSGLN